MAVMKHLPPKLVAKDIRKSFGALDVLKGVSLAAADHEVIAILGASGSGKSTFLRCVNFLESPTGGSIALNGEEVRVRHLATGEQVPADPRQIERMRTKLAMVFQSFNLWSHLTVLENVIEAPVYVRRIPRAAAIDRAEALLAQVGLSDRKHYYPAHLSGGQQQRAAIARALAMDPDVLLFDEPTSALDLGHQIEVFELIRQLSAQEGKTVVMVVHDLSCACRYADHLIAMHQGRVVAQGQPAQIVTEALVEQLYGVRCTLLPDPLSGTPVIVGLSRV